MKESWSFTGEAEDVFAEAWVHPESCASSKAVEQWSQLRDEAPLLSFDEDAEQAGDVEAVREGGGVSVRFINEHIGDATF